MGKMSMSLFAKKLATENCDWLDFVRAVYVCQKLELAIQRYASPTIIQYIQSISSDVENIDIFKGTKFAYNPGEESGDELDQVLGLVIGEISCDAPSSLGHSNPSEQDIIACLNKLLYPKSHRQSDFLSSVRNGSVYRALVSSSICEALLVDSVSVENSFSLLKVALESGCEYLAHVCLECCLAHFAQAVDLDRKGFTQLPQSIIKYILQNDYLNVTREEDVLAAISIWVEYDLVNRMNTFVDLFATGIRFSEIDYHSLANIIDSSDLIGINHQATELAAHELIQKTMGTSRENALGLGTICRPRKPHQTSRFETSGINKLRNLIHSMIHNNKKSPVDRGFDKENLTANIGSVFDGAQILVSPSKSLATQMLIGITDNESTKSLSQLLQD